ncbi:hypothetical protein Hanom_Chr16g01468041 [Helianthus anomalus]
MLYVDRTLCGYINTVRTSSPLSFWTKEMLSRRQTWEIKNGSFGKGVLREGYVDTQVDMEHETKEDRMKNVEQMVDKYEGEKKDVTFEGKKCNVNDQEMDVEKEKKEVSLTFK